MAPSEIQSNSFSPKNEHPRANAVSPHEADPFATNSSPARRNEHPRVGANSPYETDPFMNSPTKNGRTGADSDDPFFVRGCCCFWNFNCFTSRRSDKWERISSDGQQQHDDKICDERSSSNWWRKGITAIKKVREWSELVAGPKWKTFIRRFNKSGRSKPGKFQYDPFSYALNFDEGPGQIGHFDDDRIFRDFSSRYAAIPVKEVPLSTT